MISANADYAAEEEGLAFSKLRMEDKEEIRFLTDEEIARMRDVAYNGYFLRFLYRGNLYPPQRQV